MVGVGFDRCAVSDFQTMDISSFAYATTMPPLPTKNRGKIKSRVY
jgi:hypothetical protein